MTSACLSVSLQNFNQLLESKCSTFQDSLAVGASWMVLRFKSAAESLVAVISSPSAFVVSAFPSVALSADGVFVSFSCFNGYVYS